jgi:antitoxin CptB
MLDPIAPPPGADPRPRDPRRRRLLFRATHRGTHETDLLVGGYVTSRVDGLSESELDALEQVLELPDPDLADWLTGRRPIPPESDSAMLRAMRTAALR